MADVFDDIYAQAMILTGGNISLLTTTELVPLWADYQKTSNGKTVNDVRVISTDAGQLWLAVIDHINKVFADKPQPVPNYLQACGGGQAIQRVLDADSSILPGKGIYHPAYIFEPKFPLSAFCVAIKTVTTGVRIYTTVLI